MQASAIKREISASGIARYGAILAVLWTSLIVYSLYWEHQQHGREALLLGKMQSQAFFAKDIIYRRWGARHGGVYAPVTESTQPNPHLSHLPERDITTPSGRKLTLINPAYMTRQVFEMSLDQENLGRGHITSLNPIRPANTPDEWERQSLEAFERGQREAGQIVNIAGKPHYRYMQAMVTEKPCLKCHASQGYREGQVRGGISVSVPLEPIHALMKDEMRGTYANHLVIWLLGLGTVGFGTRRLGRITTALQEKAAELECEVEERQTAQEALQEQTVLLEEEIAERRNAEEVIRFSEEKFVKSFENAPFMMSISKAAEGTYLEVNRKFLEVSGFSREESLGRNSVELGWLTPDQRRLLVDEVLNNGRCADLLLTPRTKSGRLLSCRFYGEQITVGDSRCVLVLAHDVTDQKIMEEQLRQSQKMEAIGQLAGGVAHDFNNILTVIMGYGNLLQMDSGLNEHQKKEVEQIILSSEKAAQLTRGLLAFSRKEAIALRKTDLNDVVIHVQKFLARVIGEDIRLKSECYGTALPIMADGAQMEQVLINLATNGRDAMPKGGVLSITTGRQQVDESFVRAHGYGAPGSYACLTVSDDGCGMDADTCARIFEPFFTTKDSGKGTGLGMAIVYGIVKQHQGFINVYSEPGTGTTFRIYLPLCGDGGSGQEDKQLAGIPVSGGDETILVVEDNDSVRELIRSILSSHGYRVLTAACGQEGVELFAGHHDDIRLVLMDVIMPGMNGQETLQEIKRIKPHVQALYLSGYTADVLQNRGVEDSSVELIMKPIHPMELLRTVREKLDGAGR